MFAARRRQMQEEEARALKRARQTGENTLLVNEEEDNDELPSRPDTTLVHNKPKLREYQYTAEDMYNFIHDEMADPLNWKSQNGMPAISVWVYQEVNASVVTQAVDKIRLDNELRGHPWDIDVRTETDSTFCIDFAESVTSRILSYLSKHKDEK